MALNDTYVTPEELTGFVREVPFPANFTLNNVLQNENIADIVKKLREIETVNRAAEFRSWDAESPIGRRDGWTEAEVKLPPISKKLILGEYERIQLERMRTGGNNTGPIIDAIYDDAAILTKEILVRMEVARAELLSTGLVTLRENGLNLQYNAGVPAGNFNTVAIPWSTVATATPLDDITATVNEWEALNGDRPGLMLMSPTALGNMLRNAGVRNLVANVVSGAPSAVTRQQLNQVLQAYELPPIATYSAKYRNSAGADVDVMPADKVIFLPTNPRELGLTAWGVTAHGLMLAGGSNPRISFSQAPGLVGVVEETGDAVRLLTSVHAVGLPLLEQPKKLFVLDVTP